MATETLHFENARFAQQLFNNEPRNLQALETELGVKATAREGWIKLDGPAADIERAKQLFASLQHLLQAGASVKNREFTHALNVVKHEGGSTLKEMVNDRVQTHDRKPGVTAKTVGQKKYLEAIRKHDITFGIGPAGTGKTYLAVAMALSALREGATSRIILTRPAVEAGEALGFLPGDLYEKITPYLRPLHDALQDMQPAEDLQKLMERGSIEIAPLAYMRGRTLNNAFIILDEAQNSTAEQMLMFLTRLGHGSKAVITGDETQVDLPPHKSSGLAEAHRALKHTEGIAIVEFSRRDVVRHPLVQRIISAYEEHRSKK
ncbi:MAG TPA: PhoH family protein [Candidatus Angelobacter sp.]|nr:PhoH family protein [Candidatus Angelobacter sp.]